MKKVFVCLLLLSAVAPFANAQRTNKTTKKASSRPAATAASADTVVPGRTVVVTFHLQAGAQATGKNQFQRRDAIARFYFPHTAIQCACAEPVFYLPAGGVKTTCC